MQLNQMMVQVQARWKHLEVMVLAVTCLARHAPRHALGDGPDETGCPSDDAPCLIHRLADLFLPFLALAVVTDALLQFICSLLQPLLYIQWLLILIFIITHGNPPYYPFTSLFQCL